MICEYLDEAYPDEPLLGRTLAERVEVRRLVAWFDGKFAREVTANLVGEKFMKRLMGRGNPDAGALRAGFANMRHHLDYIGWLAETRRWLAGPTCPWRTSLRRRTCPRSTSSVTWTGPCRPAAKDWYARMKSRPGFRPLLADRVPGTTAPAHYADLDF